MIFDKFIYKPYYYISPCPCCNSKMTGYFVKAHRHVEIEWMTNEALRNGELIKPQVEIPFKNVFCIECGYTWHEVVSLHFFSLERIKQEKKNRFTNEILSDRYTAIAEEKKSERSNILTPFKRFVGKL